MAVTSERGGHVAQASSMCLMDLTAQTAQYGEEVVMHSWGGIPFFWDILLYQSKGNDVK
jgi:hypothetical protein